METHHQRYGKPMNEVQRLETKLFKRADIEGHNYYYNYAYKSGILSLIAMVLKCSSCDDWGWDHMPLNESKGMYNCGVIYSHITLIGFT